MEDNEKDFPKEDQKIHALKTEADSPKLGENEPNESKPNDNVLNNRNSKHTVEGNSMKGTQDVLPNSEQKTVQNEMTSPKLGGNEPSESKSHVNVLNNGNSKQTGEGNSMKENQDDLPNSEQKTDQSKTTSQKLLDDQRIAYGPKNLELSDKTKEELKVLYQDELRKEGQEIKKDFLIIFGLFASFVTFLSIVVQVFKNKDNVFELVGITSISLSFVIFFALAINGIAKEKDDWKDLKKPTYVLNILFAVIGVISLYIGGKSSINRIDSLEQKINTDSNVINAQRVEIEKLVGRINAIEKSVFPNKAEKEKSVSEPAK